MRLVWQLSPFRGANYAVSINAPAIAVVIAAVMTGAGGGAIRDVFAGRKPMIFHSEIYGFWAALAGLFIGLDWISGPYVVAVLFIGIVSLRMASYHYNWNLPRYFSANRKFKTQ